MRTHAPTCDAPTEWDSARTISGVRLGDTAVSGAGDVPEPQLKGGARPKCSQDGLHVRGSGALQLHQALRHHAPEAPEALSHCIYMWHKLQFHAAFAVWLVLQACCSAMHDLPWPLHARCMRPLWCCLHTWGIHDPQFLIFWQIAGL
jgi:hypothetical protein